MLARHTPTLTSIVLALFVLLGGGEPAGAQVRPQVRNGFGLTVATFTLPEGTVTAYLPDDVAPGETFSGTLEGPEGFVLTLGEQRARTGARFAWAVPAGEPRQRFTVTLLDPAGSERARASLRTGTPPPRDTAFRFPPLAQAGKPLSIRGPLDGDLRTTRVEIGGALTTPVAESARRVIVHAPEGLLGPATVIVTKAGTQHRGAVRGLSITTVSPAGASSSIREVTVTGLSGIDRDVPMVIGSDRLYLHGADVTGQPAATVRREFSNVRAESEAELVIPQSLRDEVAIILRTPQWSREVEVARQHGTALNGLDFDALLVAEDLLSDSALGNAAVYAMLAADQPRALSLIFNSMPDSGVNVQFLGFLWFLDHHRDARDANVEAREAALRVLSSFMSTATAQLAVHVVGVTGTNQDVPMLERLFDTGRTGAAGLKDASRSSLIRLGSRKHLDDLRAELARPLPPGATYRQGVRLSEVLRIAAYSGHTELVPAVCGHIADPAIVEIDVYVYPDRSAAEALNAITNGSLKGPKRSIEEWKTYCGQLPASGV
jgi:hypothetical protein